MTLAGRAAEAERDAIVVVTGLPRSGTSLMMSALGAGGLPLLTDGARPPDLDNPRGYFELERVRSLPADTSWLPGARGKAVKVVSALLEHLPRELRYQVLFLRRDLDEVLASQARMLRHRGKPHSPAHDPTLRAALAAHLQATERLLRGDGAFEVLDVRFRALVETPDDELDRVARFLGRPLDREAMRRCVDPALYRNRLERDPTPR